ncbi:MAG TPA: hypothetical protein VK563_17460 [Puia sp.]|nr:hypothetical protein [Puia sp.]
MPNWLRALIAGYGAKKLGGGCFSTILIFVVIYYALGQCNHPVVRHGSIRPVQQKVQTASVVDAAHLR